MIGVARAVAEAEEAREDLADAGDVGVDIRRAQQLAALVLAGGIADLGGAAAHEHDGAVAMLLQPAQQHDLHQAADMQGIRRGVEADIAGDAALAGERVQRLQIGALVEIARGR